MREPWDIEDIELPAEEDDTDLPADIDAQTAPREVIRLNPLRRGTHRRKAVNAPPRQPEQRKETVPAITTELPQPEAPGLPRLATLNQVARSLSVSSHTIRSWVRKGKLRPVRICRRLLFSPTEIERFLSNSQS